MKYRASNIIISLVCAFSIAASADAYAKRDDHGKHGNKHRYEDDDHRGGKGRGRHSRHDNDDVRIIIGSSDRVIFHDYLREYYHCPPGLAKKNNGCLPPGQAKRYRIGHVLPDYVYVRELPSHILRRVYVPHGHHYAIVDNDVLLISEATHKVVDAITLLSAVGN